MAELLHIGPAGVRYLAHKPDFPEPVKVARVRGTTVRIWLRADVERWGALHGYLGRAAELAAQATGTDGPPAGSGRLSGPIRAVRDRSRHYVRRVGG